MGLGFNSSNVNAHGSVIVSSHGDMSCSQCCTFLMQWTKQQGIETRVLSDCNTTFISHMLAAGQVSSLVSAIYTNPAIFTRVDQQVNFFWWPKTSSETSPQTFGS